MVRRYCWRRPESGSRAQQQREERRPQRENALSLAEVNHSRVSRLRIDLRNEKPEGGERKQAD